jgi:hypothetical protein
MSAVAVEASVEMIGGIAAFGAVSFCVQAARPNRPTARAITETVRLALNMVLAFMAADRFVGLCEVDVRDLAA